MVRKIDATAELKRVQALQFAAADASPKISESNPQPRKNKKEEVARQRKPHPTTIP
jgi:hypothetical protein